MEMKDQIIRELVTELHARGHLYPWRSVGRSILDAKHRQVMQADRFEVAEAIVFVSEVLCEEKYGNKIPEVVYEQYGTRVEYHSPLGIRVILDPLIGPDKVMIVSKPTDMITPVRPATMHNVSGAFSA
jgi:hypothetical protein